MIRLLRIPIQLDGDHCYELRMCNGVFRRGEQYFQISDNGFHYDVSNNGHKLVSFPRTNDSEFDPFTDIPVLGNQRCECCMDVILAMGWAKFSFVQYGVDGKICESSVKLKTGLNALRIEIDDSSIYGRFELQLSGAGTMIFNHLKVETFAKTNPTNFSNRIWRVFNPAKKRNYESWGDFHFGAAVVKYLERNQQTVCMPLVPTWNEHFHEDGGVNLVIRGKYHEFSPREGTFNILWNISHPDSVSIEEYERYDLVFVASVHYASDLRSRCNVPVLPLLQCTDYELFNRGTIDKEGEESRSGIVFVGGGAGRKRDLIQWAVESGLPLSLYGPDWGKPRGNVKCVSTKIANSELADLYRSSKVTLNDHWSDMAKNGFLNNRIFDALACGTIVLNDYVNGIEDIFENDLLIGRNKKELVNAVFHVAAESELLKKRTEALDYWYRMNFAFENRIKVMLSVLEHYFRSI